MKPGVSDLLLHIQNEILEAVASGDTLHDIAGLLCRRIENLVPAIVCSVLTVDPDQKLHPLAGPSLPDAYSEALEGIQAGPNVGSCGTAAYRGEAVIVADIESDPLWADFKALALPLGLRACWSTPIKSRDGRVVGTFAFYYRTVRTPDELERRIVQTCVHLCAIAIEHEEVHARDYRLAYFDALTGLSNRTRFDETLCGRVHDKAGFGLLLVDIDHLKSVNDTMGHLVGDFLIKSVANMIGKDRPGETAFRLGGDEFAVIIDGVTTAEDLAAAAQGVLHRTSGPVTAGVDTIFPSVTIGGALFGADGVEANTLRQNADFALYHAKETNRGGYVQFRTELRTSIIDRICAIRTVDAALAEGRITAHYQPIAQLASSEIVGLEALVRITDLKGTVSPAGDFAAAFSDTKIASRVTEIMLNQVASDIREWLDLGIPVEHVGINVTTGDFQYGNLQAKIEACFAKQNVPLKHIVLEVNESVFMGGSDQFVAKAVKRLRDKGLLVALDDFGTGYASLTHLMSFPVDVIKIDRSFVGALAIGKASSVIVAAIMDMANRLDMRVIAEGIESLEQVRQLSELGCQFGQGYLFGKPVSAADIRELLLEQHRRAHARSGIYPSWY
ncbi:putative bifunctional diguanylate cyclase/phosphodiesterase [Phyllobacterium endophyticum]|uniref:putative bifunctional diguanylate cyclase/phosphodiesterase n=1 Tax=Phyllobacterium endophyticum TaxID=1149773 RepID=UPI0011C7823D|nr:EAL domain-containing protein [Phyllobacterium endophyticum]TXR47927.1 EAL domain-containing protein [Phyllobacterium endophyticum]